MLKERLVSLSYTQKRIIQILADVLLIWIALWLAFYLRMGSEGWLWPGPGQTQIFLLAPILAVPFFIRLGMYRAVMRYVGTDALTCIFKAVSIGLLALGSAILLLDISGTGIFRSRSVLFMYWCLSLLLLGGLRLVAREYFTGDWFTAGRAVIRPRGAGFGIPVAIYGAGGAGNQLLASIKIDGTYKPVAFVDDDPNLAGRTVSGLPVYPSERIGEMIAATGVEELFLAIPSATRMYRQKILSTLEQYPLHVRTMPAIADIASGKVKVDDLQEVDIADLLGRDCVPPDHGLFERCIKSRAVMVTGAGGSIGSELCRQIVSAQPRTLILFEHSEFALYAIHTELASLVAAQGLSIQLIPILGSIRNKSRLEQVTAKWGVHTIYHAAAYKHVPIVEFNVAEGIMNNVFGTLNVAQVAIKCQVENVVLISTDKAVRPTNVMGSTKRMAEMLMQALSVEKAPALWGYDSVLKHMNRTRFTMVRFGNVLGSSGSVIPLFREQIRAGGPVTVTHPEITRYFMTIPEAAQLVIQAGAMGTGGDVFVLDMGEPVKIANLARKMISLSGLSVKDSNNPNGDIEIVFSGLRPGEKLYEELLIGDNPQETQHPKIRRASEVFISWDRLLPVLDTIRQAVRNSDYDVIRQTLLSTALGYEPSSEIVDLLYQPEEQAAMRSNRVEG
ncbi:polysaccharide biosynthesis protein [Halopseudomonas nanhaiensis]|uniref:polysaccharide biosynthesis protein n=1 Tax=Halopseudomonas nanhaiensis TaxID=2830842 RepID=UPI001CBB6602|nr:nucleoside-diphosphate sugar epimerase/dehydratase [Halopseudomonas nanhaiensis]UAW99478.1 polysaccharide biosynthesis protein [Halopseudomonas nanhaiensis]